MIRRLAASIVGGLCAAGLALAVCAAEPVGGEVAAAPAATAEGRFEAGRLAYEQGRNAVAQQELQAALDQGLVDLGDRVAANKLLAFIACTMRHYDACKGRFRRVLVLNPKFTLTPAELAHPVWGPLFDEIKTEGSARVPVRRETAKPARQETPLAR